MENGENKVMVKDLVSVKEPVMVKDSITERTHEGVVPEDSFDMKDIFDSAKEKQRFYGYRVYCACYNGHTGKCIYCLGQDQRSECVQKFRKGADRKKFMEEHCASFLEEQRCPLYEVLYRLNEDVG